MNLFQLFQIKHFILNDFGVIIVESKWSVVRIHNQHKDYNNKSQSKGTYCWNTSGVSKS